MTIDEIVFLCVVILITYLVNKGDEYEEKVKEDEDIYSLGGYETPPYEDEEIIHHPVTGYSGTREQMDAYIQNRERKLKGEL